MTLRSQNGWTVILSEDSRLMRQWTIPGVGFYRPLYRRGPAGFLLAHWTMFFHEEIERLDAGAIADDHGWSPRRIAGTDEWSNHASATAGDLNSVRHPYGQDPLFSFTPVQLDRMEKVLARVYDGTLRHGAFYRSDPDGMHVEIDAPLAAVQRVAVDLADSARGRAILDVNPGQRRWFDAA